MMRRVLITVRAASVLMLLTGISTLVYWQRTPPILLQHVRPQEPALMSSPFHLLTTTPDVQRVRAQPRPAPPRKSLWIEVPALQIELPVRPGDGSNRIPEWVALTYPGTVAPGSPGDSYIYAHGLWGMFGGLLFSHVGDEVILHNYDTKRVEVFHVTRVVGSVPYNDDRWLHLHSSTPMLTLQTCVDYNPTGDRFIVLAG